MLRRTKIVATLGTASSDQKVLEKMIRAGVDLVRMNFSHGPAQDHVQRAEMVRAAAAVVGRTVGILADLQGPKIRVRKFEHDKITLNNGDTFILDAALDGLGNQQRVGLDYEDLPKDVSKGSVLLLNDGLLEFNVIEVKGQEIICRVVRGGVLSNNKGINRKGGGLTAPALADIIDASDAIMVARGDLSVEVGDAAVPGLQKRMIKMARAKNRLVITATQMMESMISSPIPTRAEVSDVANAVLDGTDAVMLSAETAAGLFPVEAGPARHRVCLGGGKESGKVF